MRACGVLGGQLYLYYPWLMCLDYCPVAVMIRPGEMVITSCKKRAAAWSPRSHFPTSEDPFFLHCFIRSIDPAPRLDVLSERDGTVGLSPASHVPLNAMKIGLRREHSACLRLRRIAIQVNIALARKKVHRSQPMPQSAGYGSS